jgi:hypothetical protein
LEESKNQACSPVLASMAAVVAGAWPRVAGVVFPDGLELVHVGGVDLGELGVLIALLVAAVDGPVGVVVEGLGLGAERRGGEE